MTDLVERLHKRADDKFIRDAPLMREAADEIERLTLENWQLKGALGYPVPGHIPNGDFKCGLCEAKTNEIERLRAKLTEYENVPVRLRHITATGKMPPDDMK